MGYQCIDPFTGEELNYYEYLDRKVVNNQLRSAESAYKGWRYLPLEKRLELFHNLKISLEKNLSSSAVEISKYMGKPLNQSESEIKKCIDLVDFYIHRAEEVFESKFYDVGKQTGLRHLSPIGAILGIMPWNFPFWQTMRFALPALCVGNVVLLKHAPNSFSSAETLERIFLESGFEENVFATLPVSVDEVDYIISQNIVQGVALTGSLRAGSSVASIAGKYMKRNVMELGGNDPFIVFEDADIENAVDQAFESRLNNNGQVCISAKRFFIHAKKYDDFVSLLLDKLKGLENQSPFEDDAFLTCIARADLTENLKRQVEKLMDNSGCLFEGSFYENQMLPFVFELNDWVHAREEEIFGPVFCLGKFTHLEEVIQLANDTPFGLAAAIFTKEDVIIESCMEQLDFGTISINRFTKSYPELPFGGTKKSGYGKELSLESIEEFANKKTIFPI